MATDIQNSQNDQTLAPESPTELEKAKLQKITDKINAKLNEKSTEVDPNLQRGYLAVTETLSKYQTHLERFSAADYHTTTSIEEQKLHFEEYELAKNGLLKVTIRPETSKDSAEKSHPSLNVFKGIIEDFVHSFDTQVTKKDGGGLHISDRAREMSTKSVEFFKDVKDEFKDLEQGLERSLGECQKSIAKLSENHSTFRECFKTASETVAKEVIKAVTEEEMDFLMKHGPKIIGGIIGLAANPATMAIFTNPYFLMGALALCLVGGLLSMLFGDDSNDKNSARREKISEEVAYAFNNVVENLGMDPQLKVALPESKSPTTAEEPTQTAVQNVKTIDETPPTPQTTQETESTVAAQTNEITSPEINQTTATLDEVSSNMHHEIDLTQDHLLTVRTQLSSLDQIVKIITVEETIQTKQNDVEQPKIAVEEPVNEFSSEDKSRRADALGVDLETPKSQKDASFAKADEFMKTEAQTEEKKQTGWVAKMAERTAKSQQVGGTRESPF